MYEIRAVNSTQDPRLIAADDRRRKHRGLEKCIDEDTMASRCCLEHERL